MLRFRRYRVFLFVAAFIVLSLYYLRASGGNSWRETSFTETWNEIKSGARGGRTNKDDAFSHEEIKGQFGGNNVLEDGTVAAEKPIKPGEADDFPQIDLPGIPKTSPSSSSLPPQKNPYALSLSPTPSRVSQSTRPTAAPTTQYTDHLTTAPKSSASSREPLHWSKYAEHFPIPTESLIPRPTGKGAKIPQIQHNFKDESASDKSTRETRRDIIKKTFLRHWDGYREFAWEHDELKPISGQYKDPFAGWRATLVDSLDVLWIMGLKDEFEEAVNATKYIDFTTTHKDKLPLFEVTIRYMGGLLAAYDISGHEYDILLRKAVELGEILMMAFDTPNRMPQAYFSWQPYSKANLRAAQKSTVLAELGSLSMEFTRLSQLTGEPKYYDAVARITNEFEKFQDNTGLPGLWPLNIDASGGCSGGYAGGPMDHSKSKGPTKAAKSSQSPVTPPRKNLLVDAGGMMEEDYDASPVKSKRAASDLDDAYECPAHGLKSPFGYDKYTLGGSADSVYEYLPKEYLLLNGANDQYKNMHKAHMKPVRQYLTYRPMIPDEKRRILFTGAFSTRGNVNETTGLVEGGLDPETGHLTCFAGAYIGLGAKIFGGSADELDIAEQLTDGCVWAYESTNTGIMPETIVPVPCERLTDEPCAWNETRWWNFIDPYAEQAVASNREARLSRESMAAEASRAAHRSSSATESIRVIPAETGALTIDDLHKRQLDDTDNSASGQFGSEQSSSDLLEPDILIDPLQPPPRDQLKPGVLSADAAVFQGNNAPKVPSRTFPMQGHSPAESYLQAAAALVSQTPLPENMEDHMKKRIHDNRLFKGVYRIPARNYILRPEAIESVFYMHRITGDPKWAEKAWKMFNSIDRATKVEHGNSAIHDVTADALTDSNLKDEAESFWTAETLKYFYLVFSEPDLVSLDEWVLNTEAHPFKWKGTGSGWAKERPAAIKEMKILDPVYDDGE